MTIATYVSGPYSDNPQVRALDACREADRLEKKFPGVIFLAPQAMFHWVDLVTPKSYEDWMRYCFELLDRCDINHRYTLAPSPGADREMRRSFERGQRFSMNDHQLEYWLREMGWEP